MRRIVFAALAVLFAATPVWAAERQTAALSADDRATIGAVESALNSARTVQSRFVQASSNGGTAEGMLWISRPGKLRIDYAPPTQMKLIVEGSFLVQVDTKLQTLTYIPLSRTPAEMLVRGDIKLDGDIAVTGIARSGGLLRVTMVRPGAEDEGNVTLIFSESPMILRQWVVVDAQGIETRVTLMNPETNIALDPKTFDFDASKYERTRFD